MWFAMLSPCVGKSERVGHVGARRTFEEDFLDPRRRGGRAAGLPEPVVAIGRRIAEREIRAVGVDVGQPRNARRERGPIGVVIRCFERVGALAGAVALTDRETDDAVLFAGALEVERD